MKTTEEKKDYNAGWRDGQSSLKKEIDNLRHRKPYDQNMVEFLDQSKENDILKEQIKAVKAHNAELINENKIIKCKVNYNQDLRACGVRDGIIYSIICVLLITFLMLLMSFFH